MFYGVFKSERLKCEASLFLAPNPKGLGPYNLVSVRPYVRTSVDSDLSEVYGSNSLKLYTKIRYGLRLMHVK